MAGSPLMRAGYVAFLLLLTVSCQGARLYVSPSGSDLASGGSWDAPVASISKAVSLAVSGDEVWVRAGVYEGAVVLDKPLKLYGGFAGTETLVSQRPAFPRSDSDPYASVLDAAGSFSSTITTAPPPASGTNIDGFRITGGTGTQGPSAGLLYGGGVYIRGGMVTLTNCQIYGNSASRGGGIYAEQSLPMLSRCTIFGNHAQMGGGVYGSDVQLSICTVSGNTATSKGGGAYFAGGSSVANSSTFRGNLAGEGGGLFAESGLPTVSRNLFINNSATLGGAVRAFGALLLLERNTILENTASSEGGGAYLQGGNGDVFGNKFSGNSAHSGRGGGLLASQTTLRLANSFFSGNFASTGGAIGSYDGTALIVNNTVVGNAALEDGAGGIAYDSPSATIANNIVAYNSSGVANEGSGNASFISNCVYNDPGQDYIGVSPGQTDLIAEPSIVSTSLGRLHIQPGSICINAGTNSAIIANQKDIDQQSRVQGSRVDIGADESDGTTHSQAPVVVRVRPTGSDLATGESWTLAKRTVQAALDEVAASGGEVWVAAGTYAENVVVGPYTALLGGFSGVESLSGERNWKNNSVRLEALSADAVVTVNPNDLTSSISGFTITGGTGPSGGGGGIRCNPWASPIISNNLIYGNSAPAGYGGGILALAQSSPLITNNLIRSNSSAGGGGGIAIWSRSGARIVSNTISGNTAPDGGGLYCNASSPSIVNNIIALNSTGIRSTGPGNYWVRNNNVYNPGGYDYSGTIEGLGITDISEDPAFASGEAVFELSDISGCINSGASAAQESGDADVDGRPRISGSSIDIGAFEYQLPAVTAQEVPSARSASDGEWADLSGAVVTAAFDGYLYIQSPDRTSGIRVEKAAHASYQGQVASVVGKLQTNEHGERFISAAGLRAQGFESAAALTVSSRSLGGGMWQRPGSAVLAGVTGAVGLNNVGLLVHTVGRVTSVQPAGRTFTIWDGSAWQPALPMSSPSGAPGVTLRSQAPLPAWLEPGVWLAATGPVSCVVSGSARYPVLLLRSAEELIQL